MVNYVKGSSPSEIENIKPSTGTAGLLGKSFALSILLAIAPGCEAIRESNERIEQERREHIARESQALGVLVEMMRVNEQAHAQRIHERLLRVQDVSNQLYGDHQSIEQVQGFMNTLLSNYDIPLVEEDCRLGYRVLGPTMTQFRDDDPDWDGLINASERDNGTSISNPDTDYDGVSDRYETANTGPRLGDYSNPLSPDSDGDGLCDSFDPWPTISGGSCDQYGRCKTAGLTYIEARNPDRAQITRHYLLICTYLNSINQTDPDCNGYNGMSANTFR